MLFFLLIFFLKSFSERAFSRRYLIDFFILMVFTFMIVAFSKRASMSTSDTFYWISLKTFIRTPLLHFSRIIFSFYLIYRLNEQNLFHSLKDWYLRCFWWKRWLLLWFYCSLSLRALIIRRSSMNWHQRKKLLVSILTSYIIMHLLS